MADNSNSMLIGRDKEISQILDDIQNNKNGSTWLIRGDSGMGKSAFLDEVYERLTKGEIKDNTFVGYYSNKESLIAESESLIYPFRVVLESLAKGAKGSQHLGERIDSTLTRVKRGFLSYAKEQGKKVGLAILEDVANKAGLQQTLEVGKDIVKAIGAEKTGMLSAQAYVEEHKDEARESYIDIFKTLLDEFGDRKFVLIFDQFEHVGRPSINFFLNFAKFMMFEERFHLVVSFRANEATVVDSSTKALFEELREKVRTELHGKMMELPGLSAQDIGKWIKLARGVQLPMVPDLKRIRENSAGLPILLEEWIRVSKDLRDHDNINRKDLCNQIIRLKDGLSDEVQKNMYRLSILRQPFGDDETLAAYLCTKEDLYHLQSLMEELLKNRIFYQWGNERDDDEDNGSRFNKIWFRHELIKRCFEDNLLPLISRDYHDRAAKFFLGLEKKDQRSVREDERPDEVTANNSNNGNFQTQEDFAISISTAYHLHMSGKCPKESYGRNRDLGDHASKIGEIDLAERCYKMALKDINHLQSQIRDEADRQDIMRKEMWLLNDLALRVYFTWGRHNEALNNYQHVLAFSRTNNDQEWELMVLNNIAMIHYNKGEYERALELYTQSLHISRKIEHQQGTANTLNNIAMIRECKGEHDEALELYTQSLDIKIKTGDQQGISKTLNNIAVIHRSKGEHDKALELYTQSLDIKKKEEDLQGISKTLNNIAVIHHNNGDYDKALEMYTQSLDIKIKTGDQQGTANTLNNIAAIHYNNGEYSKALELYTQSLHISRKIEHQQGTANTLDNIAEIHYNNGDYEDALYHVIQANKIRKRLNIPELQKPLVTISDIKDKLRIEDFNKLEEKVKRKLRKHHFHSY